MTIKTADRVFETTTSTGTGTINLAGPIAGFKSFVDGVGGGAKVPYTITQADINGVIISWECGIGTVTDAATDTLARTTVLRSTNSDSAVNFGAGTKNVYLGFLADIVPTRDENLNFIEGFGPVTGSANALVLTLPIAPKAYSDGMIVRGHATAANTGAATINVNGLGAKTMKINGADLPANTFVAGTYFEGVYNSSTGFVDLKLPIVTMPSSVSLALGQFFRSKAPPSISNNVTDANNDIDIAASVYFGTDAGVILQSAAFTKRLDALWSAGNNNGGLDTGSKTSNSNYSVWAIYNPTTFALDYIFTLSATTPLMPSGYTDKRRIGWIRTDGSSNILPFTQAGDLFTYNTGVLSSIAVNTSRTTIPLAASPVNVTTKVRITAPGNASFIFQPVTETDSAPSQTVAPLQNLFATNGLGLFEGDFLIGSSAQIYGRASSSTTCYFLILGWTDRRGRDD